ncbi:MAG TPA: S8 family serine peptidase [Candidatus Bathyarchaeia archaeon]|nr:S8 family serine peptidase [Candidatus Bathyarchaeia archaeon]
MESKRLTGAIVIAILFASILVTLQPQQSISAEALAKIDPNLVKQMEAGKANEDGSFTALVKVAWDVDLGSIKFDRDNVISLLQTEAARTQEPVITYLRLKRNTEILNTFWLANLILVKADVDTIKEVATLSTVEKVLMNFRITVPEDQGTRQIDTNNPAMATWNIEKVRAPDVWEQLGITGEGMKFATEDTGVDITHQDLADTLFTADPNDPTYPGGWAEFDSNGYWVSGSVPHDTWIHGTATYGLIVGDSKGPFGAVGMAPGAKGLGMHALSLPGGGGSFPQVLAGLEWILDPYDEYGNHYPMPRVSSHSWGAFGYRTELIDVVRNIYFAGHFIIASIGNGGEGSSGSPGNYPETFGIGATDVNDYVPSWSSGEVIQKTDFPTAPDDWPDQWVKPDVSAPGENVIVPVPGNQYIYWGGTSFSSPHVGGAAVLMLSGNPTLNPDELRTALQDTSVWYDTYYPSKPDTRYGWGRIDAFEATVMVALPQGIVGTVTDTTTGQPVYKAQVQVGTRKVLTDANGYYQIRLQPGTYGVTFSRFGYYDNIVTNVVVNPDQFTTLNAALTPVPPGYVAGHVRFEPTGIGIPGALVEALDVPVPIRDETDYDGYYMITIPPGTYDFKASVYGFAGQTATSIAVLEGQTTTLDFSLEQPPAVAVVGDYNNKVSDFLTQRGYLVTAFDRMSQIISDVPNYQTIVVNFPGYWEYVDFMTFQDFITATDTNGVGVVWLDQGWVSQTGGYLLWNYLGWPTMRFESYAWDAEYNYYKLTATDDDLAPGRNIGDQIIHDTGSYYKTHAYYMGVTDGYTANIGTVKTVAGVGYRAWGFDNDYMDSQGIVKVNRDAGNKWVLLSMHANTYYTDFSYWHDDAEAMLVNSVNWVAKIQVPHPKFVAWDLTVDPVVGLWYVDRTVSAGIKNVGWMPGTTTVQMYVSGALEGLSDVTLAPGEYTYLSWIVRRFDVGTYKATVKNLQASFRVRAPTITLDVYEYNSNKPLAGADVYGFYRKYMGPGWQAQWSQTYGGYGHSQMAQPIGDLDKDGINEVIVGGYETPGNGRARILSYNRALGTYIEEFSWTEGGGSMNSPSGATMLDLDGDGQLELVMSWAYSGSNDGVWAYKWDGTNLSKLEHWFGGFVFDVYTGDYDDDGVGEVLVANAPWGGTPYHVIALGWQAGHFVEEARWALSGFEWMENPMVWSGDIDNDGKTEVVAVISSSAYNTSGVWALHWDALLGQWQQELVYGGPFYGTPYGVVVGDLNGNGTPEIGVGNNYPGYVGAAAYLFEWDGLMYKKVWEGKWPAEYSVIEAVDMGDADNDGTVEFVAGGGNVHIITWTGTGYAEEATITETKGMLAGTIIGDTDTDGKNEIKSCDIIGLGPGSEWIFKHSPAPTPEPQWRFKKLGTTNAEGKLVFDFPVSVADVYLFVHRGDKTMLGYQYLLTKYEYVWTDTSVAYAPRSTTEAIVSAKPNSRGLELLQHLGVVWLQENGLPILWPFSAFKTNPTKIVVTPETYAFRHMLNQIDAFGSWWYYFMQPDRVAMLTAGQTYTYSFAGAITGYIKHTQTESLVKLDWNVWDSYGHQITGISLDEVSWLSKGTTLYTPVSIKPSMLDDVVAEAGQSVNYWPVIVLYDTKKKMILSGYVQWYEKSAHTSTTKAVYYAELSFVSGPYGNPNTKMAVTVIVEPTA